MRTVLSQEQLKAKSGPAWDAINLGIDQRKVYSTTIRKLAAGLEVEPQLLLEDIEQSELAEVSSENPEGGKKIGLAPHTWGYQAHSPRGVGAKKSKLSLGMLRG
jgi:hypothetical protein